MHKRLIELREKDPQAFRKAMHKYIPPMHPRHAKEEGDDRKERWKRMRERTHERFMSYLKKKNPEKYEELLALREKDPESFHEEMRKTFRQFARSQFKDKEYEKLKELGARIKTSDDPEEKEALAKELRGAVSAYVLKQFEMQEKRIKENIARLQELEKKLAERKEKKDEIVDNMVKQIIAGAEPEGKNQEAPDKAAPDDKKPQTP